VFFVPFVVNKTGMVMLGPDDRPPPSTRVKRILFGAPRDLADRSIFHRISLIPILAWIGLGADGLSSSSYGPDEAFRTLGNHTYLAIGLAALTASTVFIIAAAYSRIIEEFPQGGGGYLVATKLLGERAGVVSGCALLVDYMLTITVSIAAAGDALFSFLPGAWQVYKLPIEMFLILFLVTLNIRGVRESVITLAPIFILFAVTHLVLILGGILALIPEVPGTARAVGEGFRSGLATLGAGGMFLLFVHAYSLGGGTYTGIEAVSNGLPIMREPRVQTGRRTMLYMAVSLAFTAGGLLVCYLLWNARPETGKTMNAVLLERVAGGLPFGRTFIIVTLISEGALLVVAAQAGFIDGPRVLANMAVDSWVPRRFAALSDRLTTQNGIVLMGAASLLAMLHTRGDVRRLVIMYSINVFLTFSLSMLGMAILWGWTRRGNQDWKRKTALFAGGLVLCATILVITLMEKFREGGWLTLFITSSAVLLCFLIRGHYRDVAQRLMKLYAQLENVPRTAQSPPGEPDPKEPTAALLVGGYSGVGIHAMLNIFRTLPGHFRNIVFLSVGVVDSGGFKGEHGIEALREATQAALDKYVDLARGLGVPATSRMAIGTDAVDEAEKLCAQVAGEFPRIMFFGGQLVFRREAWYQRFLHNETAFAIQKRLHWLGLPMVILPAKVE
jgi:amino acid transporter